MRQAECSSPDRSQWLLEKYPGPWFNINMSSCRYKKSEYGGKTVVRSSYLHNGISYTGKMTSLYRIRVLDARDSVIGSGVYMTLTDLVSSHGHSWYMAYIYVYIYACICLGGCVCVCACVYVYVCVYYMLASWWLKCYIWGPWHTSWKLHFGNMWLLDYKCTRIHHHQNRLRFTKCRCGFGVIISHA